MAMMDTRAGACVPALTLPIFATMISDIDIRHILTGFLFHPDKVAVVFLVCQIAWPWRHFETGPAGGLIGRGGTPLGHMETINTALKEGALDFGRAIQPRGYFVGIDICAAR